MSLVRSTTTRIAVAVAVAFLSLSTLSFAAGERGGGQGQSSDEPDESLAASLSGGTASVNLRYRYEFVGDESFDENAHASTLRTALGYRTLPYKGFSLFLQAQNVTHVGEQKFNNRGAGHLANGITDRPVVVDPSQTRMQQAYLRIDAWDTAFDLGRREIALGDHRFVGDVGWRQNHQTFDAIYLANRSVSKTTLTYAFVDNVIRIFGDEKDMSSHFLNGLVQLTPAVTAELFAYLLDYQAFGDRGLSNQSYGAKLSGAQPLGEGERFRFLFELQYAKQTDFADNPDERDADYLHAMGGLGLGGPLNLNVKVARELLSGSSADGAFQTPLATGHKFNGWADLFLVTPPTGLVDWYLSVDGKARAAAWTVVYHDFRADEGGAAYGSELDVQLLYPTSFKVTFGAKAAFYREDGFGRDVSKVWLWTQYAF